MILVLVEASVGQRHLPQHLYDALLLGDGKLLVQATRELLQLDGPVGRAASFVEQQRGRLVVQREELPQRAHGLAAKSSA
jgi:hypothetical protein